MSEPRWLTLEEVMIAQEKQLKAFGGPAGVRDQGALESALSRPINRYHYGDFDLAVLAASLAFGLARNHAFVDGNKRATAMYVALAAGEVSEESLARWIRDNWPEAALGQA